MPDPACTPLASTLVTRATVPDVRRSTCSARLRTCHSADHAYARSADTRAAGTLCRRTPSARGSSYRTRLRRIAPRRPRPCVSGGASSLHHRSHLRGAWNRPVRHLQFRRQRRFRPPCCQWPERGARRDGTGEWISEFWSTSSCTGGFLTASEGVPLGDQTVTNPSRPGWKRLSGQDLAADCDTYIPGKAKCTE
jgi:hypothetical protein